MTKIVFSFDTEDYVNQNAADGILWVANLLYSKGIKGSFAMVGWLAEYLEKWERYDVIEALKKHEIGTHSLRHSYHPTINEYTDLEDFDKALELFKKNESDGFNMIRHALGDVDITFAVTPGDSSSYVAYYGYSDLGVKIYNAGTTYDLERDRPISVGNIYALLYNFGVDNFLRKAEKKDILELINNIPSYQETFVFYHHPQKQIVSEFYDELNFKGSNLPYESWKLSATFTPEETAKFRENYEFLVDTIMNDPRFEITSYSELAKEFSKGDERTLTLSDIPSIKEQIEEELFPVTVPDSYSLADIALALRDFLLGETEHKCGKVYGFLDTPYGISKRVTLTAEEIKECAKYFEDGKFLPEKLEVNGKIIGPADFLYGALEVLSGKTSVTLLPNEWQIDLNEFPRLKNLKYKGTWVHSPDFEDKYLSKRSRLQTWTIRLPKGTPRKIFVTGKYFAPYSLVHLF